MAKDHRFLDDITNRKMLFAHIIRSTIPKGSVSSVTLPEIPKGYYTLTWQDIPGEKNISVFSDTMPLLCDGEVRYKGEPVVVICGPSENEVLDLCRNTRIEYKTDYSLLAFSNFEQKQVADTKKFLRGSVESKFKDTPRTIEGEYRTSVQFLPLTYPIGAIARYKNDILEIQTASQWPFHVQKTASDICGLPRKSIQVQIEPYHHTYDEKLILPSVYSAIASLMAIISGKEVKIVEEPKDILEFTVKRPPVKIFRKSALNESGKIIAEDIEISIDVGAYPLFTEEILSQLILGAASIYSVTNLRIKASAVLTSSPPMNVFKGCGIGMGVFSAETHFSRIAVLQKRNPVDLRMEHLPKKNMKLPSGGILKQVSPGDILTRVAVKSDFNRKYSAYEVLKKKQTEKLMQGNNLRGIGIAIGYAGNGFTRKRENREAYSMRVKLDQGNRLYISSSSNGSTPGNIWKETAGKILGLETESIEIVRGDTTILPNSGPSFLSNDLSIMTGLVEKCCLGIKKHQFHKPLPIEEKRNFKSPGREVWDSEKLKGMPFNALSWGAAVVEIELDPVFLRPSIRGIWTLFDIGRIHNINAARFAAEAEILESLAWVNGGTELFRPVISHTDFDAPDKSVPPDIKIDFVTDSKRSSGGMAQIPDTIIPSAFVQALSQATGIYPDTVPVTPEIIFQHLELL